MALGTESNGRYFPHTQEGRRFPLYSSARVDPDLRSYPAADTAAVVTLATTGTHRYHVIGSVYWSYDDDPTGGRLYIDYGGNFAFDIDITAGGPGFVFWQPPVEAAKASYVIITLAAGGAGVTGKLNVHAWVEGG